MGVAPPHTPCTVCFGGVLISAHTRVRWEGNIQGRIHLCQKWVPLATPLEELSVPVRRVDIRNQLPGEAKGLLPGGCGGKGSWVHLYLMPTLSPIGPPLLCNPIPARKGHKQVHQPS